MKLFNCFAAAGYHTSIVTTFAVDFNAYESIALPRLREAGCNNNILIADARMLGHAMGDSSRHPRFAGRRYSVVGVQPAGVFHPKLILQLGKTSGRLLVASANMTAAGLAGNLEIVGEVKTDEEDRQAIPILRAALEYLIRFLPDASVPRRQVDWAMRRTRWLAESVPGDAIVRIEQAEVLGFLGSGAERGIGERFIDLVGKRPVKRFIAISPYWDADLNTLHEFKRQLAPVNTAVLVQPRSALFPVHHWPIGAGANLFDVSRVKDTGASRFAHAKVFIAETGTADCVLFGSANCTKAALGGPDRIHGNDEACLYRELQPGEAARLLRLEQALADSMVIEASDLPSYEPGDDIPMAELQQCLAGRFELSGELLRWWPPASLNGTSAEVWLLDNTGVRLEAKLSRVGNGTDPISYRCECDEHPCFAMVRKGDFKSSLAIIVIEQAIQQAQRRCRSRGVENALAMLDDDEAFEGLWLLDVIQKLEAAEREIDTASVSLKPCHGKPDDDQGKGTSLKLTYEQFIAGRRAAGTAGGHAGSQLASSHQESVRTFLNALIGRKRVHVLDGADEEQAPEQSWLLGDDTADGEQALEQDDRFGSDTQITRTAVEASKQRLRRQQQYVLDTQASIKTAVEHFIETMRGEASIRRLDVVDLLRLRAFLMVVLGAGSKKSNLQPNELDAVVSRRQVLPSRGDASWRRLAGRLLYEFFRVPGLGTGPLIEHVALDAELGVDLPDDVLECWATCCWALCAIRVSVDEDGIRTKLDERDQRLALNLYRYAYSMPGEALSEAVQATFTGMSSRYGERIGADAAAVRREHQRLTSQAQQLVLLC